MANEKYWSCPLDEQETTISFGRTDELADVWTNDRTMITKLDKLCESAPEYYKCIEVGKAMNDGGIMNKRYKIDKSMLSFRSKKSKPNLTEEQRERLREQMKARNVRNSPSTPTITS